MIIERFRDQDAVSVYALVGDADRGIHEGLRYIDGWIEPNFDRCFQLMECDDLRLLHQWCCIGVNWARSRSCRSSEPRRLEKRSPLFCLRTVREVDD